MAVVLPDSKSEVIDFAIAHVASWTGKESQIGLSSMEVTELGVKANAAQAALVAQKAAQQAAKDKTLALNSEYRKLHAAISPMIAKIKAFAEGSLDPDAVYAKASIPPPAKPSPAGPPTNPTSVSGSIDDAGRVIISWSGTRRNGQFYSVWRQMAGETSYTNLGAVGAKSFTDDSIPSGKAFANYIVKGHRGTQVSAGSEPLSVLFAPASMAA